MLLSDRPSSLRGPVVSPAHRPSTATAWRVIGWLGAALAIIGLVDAALHWYPLAFGSPEWEFAAAARSIAALPTASVGLAALLGSFVARGIRARTIVLSLLLVVLALLIGAVLTFFFLNAPLALRATDGPAGLTIVKTIVRTSVVGCTLGLAYLAAAGFSFRQLSRGSEAR